MLTIVTYLCILRLIEEAARANVCPALGDRSSGPARSPRHATSAAYWSLLAQDAGLCRSRIPGFGGIYGSGKLGDGPGGRITFQLLPPFRHHALQPDGDSAARSIH